MRLILASLVALCLSLTGLAYGQKKVPGIPGVSYVFSRGSVPKEMVKVARRLEEAFPKHRAKWNVQLQPSGWFFATSVIVDGREALVYQVSGIESGTIKSSTFEIALE